MLHGTGDLYASCLLAAVMAGRPAWKRPCASPATSCTTPCWSSAEQPDFKDRGVSFEPLLGKVCELL